MDGNECWPGGLSWRKKLGLGNSFLLAHRFIVRGLGSADSRFLARGLV